MSSRSGVSPVTPKISGDNAEIVNRPRAGPGIDNDSSDEDEMLFISTRPEDTTLLAKSSCIENGALRLRHTEMAGVLSRPNERFGRWHILDGTRLLSFAASAARPRGIISLTGATIGVESETTLLLVAAAPTTRCYTLRCSDADDQMRWLRALRARNWLKLGWLEKRGAVNTAFKRRWCQVDAAGDRLLYFSAPPEALECVGSLELGQLEAPPAAVNWPSSKPGTLPGGLMAGGHALPATAAADSAFLLRLGDGSPPCEFCAVDVDARGRWLRSLGRLVSSQITTELTESMLRSERASFRQGAPGGHRGSGGSSGLPPHRGSSAREACDLPFPKGGRTAGAGAPSSPCRGPSAPASAGGSRLSTTAGASPRERSKSNLLQAFDSMLSAVSGRASTPAAAVGAGGRSSPIEYAVALRAQVELLPITSSFQAKLWKLHRLELLVPARGSYRLYCTPRLRLVELEPSASASRASEGHSGGHSGGHGGGHGGGNSSRSSQASDALGSVGADPVDLGALGGSSLSLSASLRATTAPMRGREMSDADERRCEERGAGTAPQKVVEVPLRTATLSSGVADIAGRSFVFILAVEEANVHLALAAPTAGVARHVARRLREAILASTDEEWQAEHDRHEAAALVQAAWAGSSSRKARRVPATREPATHGSTLSLPMDAHAEGEASAAEILN